MKKTKYINIVIASLLLTIFSLIVGGGIYWEQVILKGERERLTRFTGNGKHAMSHTFAMESKLQQARGKWGTLEIEESEEEKVEEEVITPPVDDEVAEEVAEEEVVLPQYGYLRRIFFEWPTRYCYDTFYGYPDYLPWVEYGYEHSIQKSKIALYLSSPFSYRVVAKSNQTFLREEWQVRRWQKETGGYEAYRRDSVEEGMYRMMFTAVAALYSIFCLFIIWGLALFLFPAPVAKDVPTELQGDAFSFSEEVKNIFGDDDAVENPAMNVFIKRLRVAACLFDKDKKLTNGGGTRMVSNAIDQFKQSSTVQNNVAFLKTADMLLSESDLSLCWDKVHRHFWESNPEGCQTLMKAILTAELCPHLIELLFKNSALLQKSIRSVLGNRVYRPLQDNAKPDEKEEEEEKKARDISAVVDKVCDGTIGAFTSIPTGVRSILKEVPNSFSNLKKIDFSNILQKVKSIPVKVKRLPFGGGDEEENFAVEKLAESQWDDVKDAAMLIFEQKDSVEEAFLSRMEMIDVDREEEREAENARQYRNKLRLQILSTFSPAELLSISNRGKYGAIIRGCLNSGSNWNCPNHLVKQMLGATDFLENEEMRKEIVRLFHEKKDKEQFQNIFIERRWRKKKEDDANLIVTYFKRPPSMVILKEALVRFFCRKENITALCSDNNVVRAILDILEECLLGMGEEREHIRAVLFKDSESQKHLVASTFYEEAYHPIVKTIERTGPMPFDPWFGNTLQKLLQRSWVQACIYFHFTKSLAPLQEEKTPPPAVNASAFLMKPLDAAIRKHLAKVYSPNLESDDDVLRYLFYSGMFHDKRVRDTFIFAFLDNLEIQNAFDSDTTTLVLMGSLLWQNICASFLSSFPPSAGTDQSTPLYHFLTLLTTHLPNPLRMMKSTPLYHLSTLLTTHSPNPLIKQIWVAIFKKLDNERWGHLDYDELLLLLSQWLGGANMETVAIFATLVSVLCLSAVAKDIYAAILRWLLDLFADSFILSLLVGAVIGGGFFFLLDKHGSTLLGTKAFQAVSLIITLAATMSVWVGIEFIKYFWKLLSGVLFLAVSIFVLFRFPTVRALILNVNRTTLLKILPFLAIGYFVFLTLDYFRILRVFIFVAAPTFVLFTFPATRALLLNVNIKTVLAILAVVAIGFLAVWSGVSSDELKKVMGGGISFIFAVIVSWRHEITRDMVMGRTDISEFRTKVHILMMLLFVSSITVSGYVYTDIKGSFADYIAALQVGLAAGTLASILFGNIKIGFLVGFLVIVNSMDQCLIGFFFLWHGLLCDVLEYMLEPFNENVGNGANNPEGQKAQEQLLVTGRQTPFYYTAVISVVRAFIYGVSVLPIPLFLSFYYPSFKLRIEKNPESFLLKYVAIFIVPCVIYYVFIPIVLQVGIFLSLFSGQRSKLFTNLRFLFHIAFFGVGFRWAAESNHPIVVMLRLFWEKTWYYKMFAHFYRAYLLLGNRFLSDKILNKANHEAYVNGAVIYVALLTVFFFSIVGILLHRAMEDPISLFNSKLIILNVLWVSFCELWKWSLYTDFGSFGAGVRDYNTYLAYMKRFKEEWVALVKGLLRIHEQNGYYIALILIIWFCIIYYTVQLRILELISFCWLLSVIGVFVRKVLSPNTQVKRMARGFALLGIASLLIPTNYLFLTFVRYSYSRSYADNLNKLLLAPHYYDLVRV